MIFFVNAGCQALLYLAATINYNNDFSQSVVLFIKKIEFILQLNQSSYNSTSIPGSLSSASLLHLHHSTFTSTRKNCEISHKL